MSETLDTSDVDTVWKAIVQKGNEKTFAIFSYAKGSDNKLKVDASGVGGVESVQDNLRDGVVQFVLARVSMLMHGTPVEKVVLIFFCEEGSLQPARRAIVIKHDQQLGRLIKPQVHFGLTQSEDFTESTIATKLRMLEQPAAREGSEAEESKE